MPVCWSLSVGAQREHGNEEECVAQLVLPAGQEDACKDFMDCGRGAGQAVLMAAGAVPGAGASPLLLTTVQQLKAKSVLPQGRGGPAFAHLARGRSREASQPPLPMAWPAALL